MSPQEWSTDWPRSVYPLDAWCRREPRPHWRAPAAGCRSERGRGEDGRDERLADLTEVEDASVTEDEQACRCRAGGSEVGLSKRAAGTDVVWYPFHRSLATAVAERRDGARPHESSRRISLRSWISASSKQNMRHARALVCSWPHPFDSSDRTISGGREEGPSRFRFRCSIPVVRAPARRTEAQPVTLIYPGYVTEHKDHETLIRALALLPDVRLICTGAETPYARTVRESGR